MSTWVQLYESGELLKLARLCSSAQELAERVHGIHPDISPTGNAAVSGWRRVRDQYPECPPMRLAFEPDWSEVMPFGTPEQQRLLQAYLDAGRDTERAAQSIGVARSTISAGLSRIRKRAEKRGWSPGHDMTHTVPETFHVAGVTTQYGADGTVTQQWVKSRKNAEERTLEAIAAAAESLHIPIAQPVTAPDHTDEDLLTVIPIGDHHFGMIASQEEAGQDWDLQQAESVLAGAAEYLVDRSPPSAHAVVAAAGDLLHADNRAGTTTKGTPLDADLFTRSVRVTIRAMVHVVDLALRKHQHVHVISALGNHDSHAAWFLALILERHFAQDPRVTVDTAASYFHYYRFGQVLLGFHHGDKAKASQLSGVMAYDRREDWAETRYWHWYTGHLHHKTKTEDESSGVTVESLRVLPPTDRWHRGQGYRSGREMFADVWHRRWGRKSRLTVSLPELMEAA